MIGYITIGVSDMEKSAAFYDAVFNELNLKRIMEFMESDGLIIWGTGIGDTRLAICKPYDGKPATAGNGTMIGLSADSVEMVDRVYKKALELGAVDEGSPGLRNYSVPGFYAGYFRDLDGNKLNCFYIDK